ncbi:MAG: hypothetical protein ACK5W9_12715 [Bdellovibrionales bacterium]
MKCLNFLLFILCLLFGSYSLAECNLKVATAAGQYLAALEEAKLRKYQNNSTCEVLNYEFWNCTEKQKSKLKSAFNLKEVLGNYCQPHLPPPKNAIDKDYFMKGAELYSWQDYSGYVWYALLPGTNRSKNAKDLNENKTSPGYLKQELKNIPPKTQIVWNNLSAIEDKSSLDFSIPDEKTVKDIVKNAEQAGLKVIVVK